MGPAVERDEDPRDVQAQQTSAAIARQAADGSTDKERSSKRANDLPRRVVGGATLGRARRERREDPGPGLALGFKCRTWSNRQHHHQASWENLESWR